MKHTPGPWDIERHGDRLEIVAGEDRAPLAEVWGDDSDDQCWPQTANGRLFAAAPDLLAALESALKNDCNWEHKAEAAIARAKGEGK